MTQREAGTRQGSNGDVLTPTARSLCMSRNRGRDTSPEMLLRHACWGYGLRYRISSKILGKPDIVFPGPRVAVFVDGCFWHGCPEHYQAPATRSDFWRSKVQATAQRDALVNRTLAESGWAVLRFWEHDLRTNDLQFAAALAIDETVRARTEGSRARHQQG